MRERSHEVGHRRFVRLPVVVPVVVVKIYRVVLLNDGDGGLAAPATGIVLLNPASQNL